MIINDIVIIVTAIATVAYVVLTAAILKFFRMQTKIQQNTVKLQNFHIVVKRMENVRADRQTLRDYIKESKLEHGKDLFPLPKEIRKAADKVSREFDYLGLLDRTGMVDSRLVDFFTQYHLFIYMMIFLTNMYQNFVRVTEI